MFKKSFIIAAAMLFASSSFAMADCTATQAQEKGMAFATTIQEAAQKNPAKYMEAVTAMQNDLPALQAGGDLDALCKFYDKWATELK